MITADARSRLTADDLSLVARCLGGTGEGTDREIVRHGLDQALDRPELRSFLLHGRIPGPSPSLFFYVLVRHSLRDEGIDDRQLADYCAALLREFALRGRAHRVAMIDDAEYHYLVDLLAAMDATSGDRHFTLSVHLGNYALWLAGVFPERIRARRATRGGPDLRYYDALGQRGFAEASEHHLAERTGLDAVLGTTAERFPVVRRALNRVAGSWAK